MTPTFGWIVKHPARFIAFGAGSGLLRPAPGTWGTLFAWATFGPVTAALSGPAQLLVPLCAFLIGVWACDKAARDMGVADPGSIVWDEVAAFWLVLALVPDSLQAQLAGFVLFRFFDIVKPPPIRHFDATLKNGFGVMFDDTLAAFYAVLVMALWQRLAG
jgi:phosphatidylglycerophosphatase A